MGVTTLWIDQPLRNFACGDSSMVEAHGRFTLFRLRHKLIPETSNGQ